MPYYSVQGLVGPFSFLASHLNGILGVIVVAIGRITLKPIASMLFGLSASDVPTIAAVSLLLLLVALFAGYLPARRASAIDPIVALRTD